jgi:rhodanese-related sulfurtransferase
MLIKQSVILLALLAISTAAPVANAANAVDRTHISATDLEQLIGQGTAPTIIDVRSSYEYQAGHIPGAIHIPFWSALYRVDEISAAKDELVIVYCAHGPRAGFGKFALTRAGYTQVLYLDGHMSGWYKAGLPVEK